MRRANYRRCWKDDPIRGSHDRAAVFAEEPPECLRPYRHTRFHMDAVRIWGHHEIRGVGPVMFSYPRLKERR